MKTKKIKLDVTRSYSAREAMQFLTDFFAYELQFRRFLREDMKTRNILNAKVYTASKRPRFVIHGKDLANAIEILKKETNQT